jgi:hypothetical protein
VSVADHLGPPPSFRSRAPRAVAQVGAAAVGDALVVRLITLDLVLLMLLQRFAVPLGGDAQFSALIATHYSLLGVLLLARRAVIDSPRLILYAVFMLLALLTQLLPDRSFSVPSLVLVAVTYAPLVAVLPIERASYRRILQNFQWIVAGVALLVFFQHACQLAGLEMPTLEHVQPDITNYHEYVYIQPLYWSSPFSKPNAIFLLEASHTSQILAMGLLLELALFHRLRFIVLFGAALVATFAGTGLLLILLSAPFLLRRLRPGLIAALILAIPLILGLAAASGWFEIVGKRLDEHEREGSSAYARFVAPTEIVIDTLADRDPEPILFGVGAGNMEKRTGVLWLAFSKVFVEYGFVVFLAWLAFFSFVMFQSSGLWVATWMTLIQYQLLNGAFLVPLHVFLCWLLAAGYRFPPAPAAPVTSDGPPRRAAKSACKAPGMIFN